MTLSQDNHKTKAYELARNREIPVIFLGKAIRVPKDALFEWIENNIQQEGNGTGKGELYPYSLSRTAGKE